MTHPVSQTALQTAPTARRSLVSIASTTAAGLALLAGSVLATAAPAQAATKPPVTFTLSTTSLKLGHPLSVRVVTGTTARPVPGSVGLYVNGKKRAHHKGVRGAKTLTVPVTALRKGTNKVHVTFSPSDKKKYVWRTTANKKVTVSATKVAIEAMKHVGTPYVWGGSTTKGFDCSGYTQYVYAKAVGVKLPRTSSAQAKVGTKVSARKAKAGDLVASPGHVAIYLGGGYLIDAPKPGRTIQPRKVWQSNPTYIRVAAKATR